MIQVKVTGIGEVSRTLYLLNERTRHGKPAWETIGQYLKARVQKDAFDGQRDFYGNAWKPLSRATLVARAYRLSRSGRRRAKTAAGKGRAFARAFPSNAKILQDTGYLKASITARATNSSVRIGSNLKYAPVHQLGSQKKHIPARPFLPTPDGGLTARDELRVREILVRYFGTGETR
jgi:phage gpG-like protein